MSDGQTDFDKASLVSKLSFSWAYPYIKFPKKLYGLPKVLDPDEGYKKIVDAWAKESQKPEPRFYRVILSAFGSELLKAGGITLIDSICQIIAAVLIGRLIEFVQTENEEDYMGWIYCSFLVLTLLVAIACRSYGYFIGFVVGGVCRQGCIQLLFNKILRVSSSLIHSGVGPGKVMSVASGDIDYLDFIFLLNFIWIGPLVVIGVIIALLIVVGPTALIGVAIIICSVPVQVWLNNYQTKLRITAQTECAGRLSKTTEVIEGIKVLKMYGWEVEYLKRISDLRRKEVSISRYRLALRATNMVFYLIAQGLATLVTFAGYKSTGETVTPAIIFTTLILFLSAQLFMTIVFPFSLEFISIYRAGSVRVTEILKLEEYKSNAIEHEEIGGLELESVCAQWKPDSEGDKEPVETEARLLKSNSTSNFSINDINLQARPGELILIEGPVGSGKTSLLLTILGEMSITEGTLKRSGTISYVEQEPWILSGTVVENIILKHSFDQTKFDRIINACGLTDDINRMANKEQTILGEKGVNVSGGQKARIALARACYADSDIYLLDDPLSAVDAKISQHLFHQCILGLLKDKTRILVTHQVQYAPFVDKVLKVDKGKATIVENLNILEAQDSMTDTLVESGERVDKPEDEEDEAKTPPIVYWQYLTFGLKWAIPLLFLIYPITMLVSLAVPYWLAVWASQEGDELNNSYYIEVLGYIILVLTGCGLIQNNLNAQSGATSAENMHKKALEAVVRSPSRFFDERTSGSIMTRFSKDVIISDEMLPWFFIDLCQVTFIVLGSFIASMIGNPFLAILFLPLLVAFVLLYRKIIEANQEFHVMYVNTKGPIFTLITTAFSGLFSLRAYNLQNYFRKTFERAVAVNGESFFAFQSIERWYQIRNELIALIFTTVNVYLAVALKGILDPTTLALGISVVLTVSLYLAWAVQQFVQVKSFMSSAERLITYSKLKPEAPLETEGKLKVTNGEVEFRNIKLMYNEKSVGIKKVDAVVQGGTKVGIVGKTGSGKSSLMVALFRLVELSDGEIFIDGQDVSKVGLHSLRRQIAVIPQTPFIFTATVRYNLDPLGLAKDDDLWRVLELTELKEHVLNYDKQLEEELNPNKLSVGQKQLMCLARALISKAKILVMDEATANVDNQTDSLIQTTIAEKFSSCTVFTVAHRLDTIINYDEVWVMKNGRLMERGHPFILASDESSHFYDLLQHTGDKKASLIKKARRAYRKSTKD